MRGFALLFFSDFAPLLAQISFSSTFINLLQNSPPLHGFYLVILQLLHPVHVYSLFLLHVYWFYNFCNPSSFIPSSSAIREMRVCSCFKAIIVIKKGQNFCNAHFGAKKPLFCKSWMGQIPPIPVSSDGPATWLAWFMARPLTQTTKFRGVEKSRLKTF